MKTITFLLRVYLISNIVRNSLETIKFIDIMLVPLWSKETRFNMRLILATMHQTKLFPSCIQVSFQPTSTMTVLNMPNSSSVN